MVAVNGSGASHETIKRRIIPRSNVLIINGFDVYVVIQYQHGLICSMVALTVNALATSMVVLKNLYFSRLPRINAH